MTVRISRYDRLQNLLPSIRAVHITGAQSAAFEMAEALSDGVITSGHVDALTRVARGLDRVGKDALLTDPDLADAAGRSSISTRTTWNGR